MANSTENDGLSKFEELQNCCPSSDTTEARLVEILIPFCSHRGVDRRQVIFKIPFLTDIKQHSFFEGSSLEYENLRKSGHACSALIIL